MTKGVLLAATAVVALTGGAVAATPMSAFVGPQVTGVPRHTPGLTVLYNQNSASDGYYVNSQNYTSGVSTSFNDEAVDDFVVPSGHIWRVKEIDVTGYDLGSPTGENVYFYRDKNGKPGKPVKGGSFKGLQGTGNPSFAISLGTGVGLKAGHYWVGVVVDCNYQADCDWGWAMTSATKKDAALWEQPGNGAATGCTKWRKPVACFGTGYAGDLMFELQGTSK